MSELWANAPNPNMGATASAGWQKLVDSILGNTTNPDGTITHTTWLGSSETINPAIPKVGFGGNTVVSTGSVPGSFSASIDRSLNAIFHPLDSAAQVVTDTADTMTRNVTQQIGSAISDQMGTYLIYGLCAIGALLIIEGIA